MIFKKEPKNSNKEQAEAIKEALKDKQYRDFTEEELAEAKQRILKDLLADVEADKKKFHFKSTREKNAKLEAKLKEALK